MSAQQLNDKNLKISKSVDNYFVSVKVSKGAPKRDE